MSNPVVIANRALGKVAANPIVDFGDDTPSSRAISRAYPVVLDAVLREHLWNFAIRRTSLPESSPAPVWKYEKAFQLPSDYLRLLEIEGQMDGYGDWQVVARRIEINASAPLNITYVARVLDVNEWDTMFREAFATRLAAEISEELTNDTTLGNRLEEVYRDLMNQAKMVDSKENPSRRVPQGSWLDSRF
jgi:hypothetical protein